MESVSDRIKAEHRDIAKVLKTLEAVVERLQETRDAGDVQRLFDICHYLRVFPDAVHHPQEDACLFGPLRERAPEHVDLLDAVNEQHAECGAMTNELFAAAKSFEAGHIPAAALKAVTARYLSFQFEHMRLEETEILPLAEEFLEPEVWGRAGEAFSGHADPLFGANLEAGFKALHGRIVNTG